MPHVITEDFAKNLTDDQLRTILLDTPPLSQEDASTFAELVVTEANKLQNDAQPRPAAAAAPPSPAPFVSPPGSAPRPRTTPATRGVEQCK